MEVASLCALGKSAPYPVTSTIQYFREEYEEHIRDHKCRAGVCKPLIKYHINKDCTGCLVCKRQCPVEAISGEKKKTAYHRSGYLHHLRHLHGSLQL